tara:strand:- start:455 stop:1093 length:639 start_codon:yes stop_codon:yes gene_type:complete
MVSILNGLFGPLAGGGCLSATHMTGGGSTTINAETMIDAIALLGDAGQDLAAVAMNSTAYYALIKADLIIPGTAPNIDAQIDTRVSAERVEIGTYLGRPVIVDDGLNPTGDLVGGGTGGADVHTIYFFAPGAIVYSEVAPKTAVETDRDILRGIEVLVNRKEYLMHPIGCSWIGTSAGNSPSNTEFSTVANWERVFTDDRNIKMTALRGIIA